MNYWAKMARTHWKQYLPEMYLKYQEQGILEKELTNAGEKAAEMMGELVESGLRRNEVLEIVLPQFILLTPEPSILIPTEQE